MAAGVHAGRMDRVVIVGGGPGGYEAAHVAAQLGAEVTVVDTDGVGGSAVLTDCVPSKTLIATAEVMTDLSESGELGIDFADHEGDTAATIRVDLGKVNARVKRLAADQSADIAARLDRDGVRVVRGRGRLGPGLTVVVTLPEGAEETLEADAILVATGAAPRTLESAQPDGERILTWEQVYDLDEVPEKLVVVGSGVTGAEFASAYLALGVPVTLVSSRDRVLPGEDADASAVLEEVATRRGMEVLGRSRMQSVTRDGDTVTVTLTDGRTVTGSHCILALGSVPNTGDLGLEEAGVATDEAGFITVDRVSRTSARGVYAAGDCTGVLMLASVAAMQGRIAMWHFLGDAVAPAGPQEGLVQRLHLAGDRHGRLVAEVRRGGRDPGRGGDPAAGRQRAGQDAGRARRLRQALHPPRHRDRRRGSGGGAARLRAHPPGVDRGRRVADRRPARAGVHRLPVDERVDRRGGPEAAPAVSPGGATWRPTRPCRPSSRCST